MPFCKLEAVDWDIDRRSAAGSFERIRLINEKNQYYWIGVSGLKRLDKKVFRPRCFCFLRWAGFCYVVTNFVSCFSEIIFLYALDSLLYYSQNYCCFFLKKIVLIFRMFLRQVRLSISCKRFKYKVFQHKKRNKNIINQINLCGVSKLFHSRSW